jgi:predicted extracellular nuclease
VIVRDLGAGAVDYHPERILVDEPGNDDASSTPTPERLETQLTKLALAIRVELRLPEILIAGEVENQAILQELGDRVNAAAGTSYRAVSFETSDVRGIEAGFLFDESRVTLVEAFQLAGPDVEAAFGPTSASPGREPLIGVFELLDADPAALVMVAGDLNDFPFGEPGEGPDHPLAILEGGPGEVPLGNLIGREQAQRAYTFVFDGNSQILDHVLVSPALLALFASVDILHFNAGFADRFRADPTTTLRWADHDPLETRFRLAP